MAEYAVNLNNGTTDEKGAFRLMGKILNQSGVIEATALTVSATTPTPDLTVKVSGSVASDNAVFITTTGDTYHGWNTTSPYSVTITANSTGVTKLDAIVAYIDTTAGSTTANNPGGTKFLAVRGSSTDGVTKATAADITASAVGTKPYLRLADVTVGNGVSSINSGNIVDARPKATVGAGLVTTSALALNAVTNIVQQTFVTSAGPLTTSSNVPTVLTTGPSITTTGGVIVASLSVSRFTNTSGNAFFGVRLVPGAFTAAGNYDLTACPTTSAASGGLSGQITSTVVPPGTYNTYSYFISGSSVALTVPQYEGINFTVMELKR